MALLILLIVSFIRIHRHQAQEAQQALLWFKSQLQPVPSDGGRSAAQGVNR